MRTWIECNDSTFKTEFVYLCTCAPKLFKSASESFRTCKDPVTYSEKIPERMFPGPSQAGLFSNKDYNTKLKKKLPRGCQGNPRPHPWDTHYQFSIITLLSNSTPSFKTSCLFICLFVCLFVRLFVSSSWSTLRPPWSWLGRRSPVAAAHSTPCDLGHTLGTRLNNLVTVMDTWFFF